MRGAEANNRAASPLQSGASSSMPECVSQCTGPVGGHLAVNFKFGTSESASGEPESGSDSPADSEPSSGPPPDSERLRLEPAGGPG